MVALCVINDLLLQTDGQGRAHQASRVSRLGWEYSQFCKGCSDEPDDVQDAVVAEGGHCNQPSKTVSAQLGMLLRLTLQRPYFDSLGRD